MICVPFGTDISTPSIVRVTRSSCCSAGTLPRAGRSRDGHYAFTPEKTVAATGSKSLLGRGCVPCAISSAKYLMAPGKGVAAASPSAQKERPAICDETSLILAMSFVAAGT